LTVRVLINALKATPSSAYLIDGFPRAIEQAEFFEQIVAKPQTVLFINTSEKICTERCMERAKTSGRVDDTEEIILKRLRTYNDMSRPVVDLYKKKGLVLEVDGGKDKEIVWEEVKKGLKSRPETSSGSACCILF
jgi:adenylate kinase family enzyme